MLYSDQEMQALQQFLESKSELDPELQKWCSPLIHQGKYDDAIRNAFVLVEERMKRILNDQTLYGWKLINAVFDENTGPLGKYIIHSNKERRGLKLLFEGAFTLYRNPTAHNFVDYSSKEAKSIIGFVNILLITLERANKLPPPNTFGKNWEDAVKRVEQMIGPEGTGRLRIFLGQCKEMGFIAGGAKETIPLRYRTVLQSSSDSPAKVGEIRVIYLYAANKLTGANLRFAKNQYDKVPGFDFDIILQPLDRLGFYAAGRGNYAVNLKKNNQQSLFDNLIDLLGEVQERLDTIYLQNK